jgi:hypothetical protein
VLVLGLSVYVVNCAAGLAAQLGRVRLGVWHHVLYAVVFATTVAALIFAFHPALLLTTLVLAVFPRARPRTISHPALAVLGLLGYLLALFLPAIGFV